MALMTNAVLEPLVRDAGKKVRAIRSTAYTILLNQNVPNSVTVDDIEFVTMGGVDLIKVKTYNPRMKNYYYKYYVTEVVEVVAITENANDTVDTAYLQV